MFTRIPMTFPHATVILMGKQTVFCIYGKSSPLLLMCSNFTRNKHEVVIAMDPFWASCFHDVMF